MINFFCVRLLHCSNRALLNRMARLMFFHWLMILDRASFTKSQKSVSLLLKPFKKKQTFGYLVIMLTIMIGLCYLLFIVFVFSSAINKRSVANI